MLIGANSPEKQYINLNYENTISIKGTIDDKLISELIQRLVLHLLTFRVKRRVLNYYNI
jgi:hypothetical protein